MSEECSKASTAGRLRVFIQTQSGISGMKNGGEATSRFHVHRTQGEKNMVWCYNVTIINALPVKKKMKNVFSENHIFTRFNLAMGYILYLMSR